MDEPEYLALICKLSMHMHYLLHFAISLVFGALPGAFQGRRATEMTLTVNLYLNQVKNLSNYWLTDRKFSNLTLVYVNCQRTCTIYYIMPFPLSLGLCLGLSKEEGLQK